MAVDDYQRVVSPAVDVFRRLSEQIHDDLSESVGGVGWWDGQVDFRRRVVLSEYLIDSLNGASEALLDAALAAQDHRESLYADDSWLVRQWRRVAENAAATNADFLAAVRQGPNELRRERRIDSSATHAISHAMRVLDCLAAAFLIIGAIPHGVRRADWGDTEKIANKIKVSSTSQSLEPLGTEGRKIQDALFTPILSWDQYGPTDWLPWLRAKRNGRIHRASRIHWQLLHGHKKRPEGLLHPFPPNPELTDIELMVRASDADFANLRIIRRSSDVLDGAVESMTSYGAALGTALADCWDTRRKSPSVLCQRGAQWQDLERVTALDFTGYGSPPEQIGNQLHVGVALGKRLRAAHVMDDARHRWAD